LSAHIRTLASDELAGRAPGSPGDAAARAYLIEQLSALGLEPGAPGGGFEQPVALRAIRTDAPATWEFRAGPARHAVARGTGFVVTSPSVDRAVAVQDAPLVFVGYGIRAPEHNWDDFGDRDLRGTVLVFLNNDPDWAPDLFEGGRRTSYGRWTYKYEIAASVGAAGAIVIHTDESAGYPWGTVESSWSGWQSGLDAAEEGTVALQAWLREDEARAVLALGGHDLDQLTEAARSLRFSPVELGLTTSLRVDTVSRRYQSANVVAKRSGRRVPEEAVVYTAHHDHIGVVPNADGTPVIYNGAVDNASGVAQVLEIARAFAQETGPLERSTYFAFVAAEEQGLLGSRYFVEHPPLPVGRMTANLNFDGGNIWGRTRDISLIGHEKSGLGNLARTLATARGRKVVGDLDPSAGAFYRSDQLYFARAGIPALFLRPGQDFTGQTADWGREQQEAWIRDDYHRPSDDWSAGWDLAGMAEDAHLGFELGLELARGAATPEWVPGDEFEAARQRSRAELRSNGSEAAAP
jgi:Zn-dependent M28 family amino/carboxypeptidase